MIDQDVIRAAIERATTATHQARMRRLRVGLCSTCSYHVVVIPKLLEPMRLDTLVSGDRYFGVTEPFGKPAIKVEGAPA